MPSSDGLSVRLRYRRQARKGAAALAGGRMVTRLIRLSGVTLLCAVALFGAFSYSGVDYENNRNDIRWNSVCCAYDSNNLRFYPCIFEMVVPESALADQQASNDYSGYQGEDLYYNPDVTLGFWFGSNAKLFDEDLGITESIFGADFNNLLDFIDGFNSAAPPWLQLDSPSDISGFILIDSVRAVLGLEHDIDDAIEDVSNYLANIEYYTKQMFFDTGTISNRLNISNGKLDTIINHFSVIEDYLSFINSDDARESYLQQTNELLTYIMERLYYSGNSAAYWLYQIANKDFTIDGNIGDITVQTQDYTSQLNTIITLLGANLASNLTDAIQDITDDFYQKFIGDLGSVDVPSTMVSTMQSAVSSVFPFCLVGMFSTLIGVFDVDNSSFSPNITFDMWGDNPMTFDLSAFSVVIPLLHFFILIFLVYGLAMVTLGWFRAGEAK